MESLPAVLAASGAFVAAGMLCMWLLSLALRDVSSVDVFWGLGFAGVAWTGFALGDGALPRRLLAAGLASVWGLRLACYLWWRSRGQPEDPRYARMRRHYGARFAWVSLVVVFGLQGAVMWVVSLPLQLAQAAPQPAALTWLDLAGASLWLLGFAFESIGDWQLARFKADPANAGLVMERGLWAWTRHPNYFGDAVVWWGFFAIAAAVPWGWLTAVGPALMTFFLVKVSGAALLERGLARSKPGYADYVARTSGFVPRPPRH